MSETIHVIGHKSPDTDTVVSAIIAAHFLNQRDSTDVYKAMISDRINSETAFVMEEFDITLPPVLDDATGKKLFLVDHNEQSQIVDGEGHIVGIIDHHKMNFVSAQPIEITTRAWGCACTILHDLYERKNVELPHEFKGPMLCAILSDTVILKSPTTTPKDVEVIKKLAEELEVDYEELGMNMFKAKAEVASKSPIDIIKNDFKDFDINGKKVGVGQIETPDLHELDEKIPQIVSAMKTLKESDKYDSIILMLTDIIEEGTKLLLVSDDDGQELANIFETQVENNVTPFIPNMMSRKKQVAPVLSENL